MHIRAAHAVRRAAVFEIVGQTARRSDPIRAANHLLPRPGQLPTTTEHKITAARN